MKPSILFMLPVAPAVLGMACSTRTRYYCGHTLLTMGDWLPDIETALANAGVEQTEHAIEDSIFTCVDDYAIIYSSACTYSCIETGAGSPDYCAPGSDVNSSS
ncbi:uncharacterized protein BO87DRAFT_207900 [Aspergillus neoniger CBS 115656]|uniref:Uncharacterized protein n=1 Tax=Aspergillus neoniger (strain CBS 115656) TaxID=1448310 RepID=A0A318YU21_ASPNB|nr:hypothetical protein BO87DRAFT_207900 [Aspergillus neoniger CBS 115656]PYH37507.1 hypothetical protein BO87DRAFT_207900 [Aspergillus neoniger CBS 115656]